MPKPQRSIPSPSLHTCMVGLVLLNLVFVQLTEAASLAWLVPLYALTLTSSLFARFKENRAYRALWNLAVVGFFTVLARHALSADLAYVLQDGLTLAVLCQVHLLNNLHRDQRPDLLFLNSYLIAIITGYITVDLGFAGAFLAYVPFYIIGLQFLSVFRLDAEMPWGDVKAVLVDGAKRSGVLLGLALLAFVFWPRDFEREALLARYLDLSPSSGPAKVDFSESLELGERRVDGPDLGHVVITISSMGAPLLGVPELWRGATLGKHERDGSWNILQGADRAGASADTVWKFGQPALTAEREVASPDGAAGLVVRVKRAGGGSVGLFAPAEAVAVALGPLHTAGVLRSEADGTLFYTYAGELHYSMAFGEPAAVDEARSGLSPEIAARFLATTPSAHTNTAADLAAKLIRRIGDEPPDVIASRFTSYLSQAYPYRLPAKGEEPASATLHEFLTTDHGGHCEYFASALATMLRCVDVPARVVTGFRVGPPDAETGLIEVRSTAAHAWVEAFVPERGWITLDPTPALDVGPGAPGLWQRTETALLAVWSRVTSFDAESRAQLTAWLGSLPKRLAGAAASSPFAAMGFLLALAALLGAQRRRWRARTPDAVRELRRAYRTAKLVPLRGETPREALGRAKELEHLDPEAIGTLRQAVEAHELARYGA